jgi:DNA-binding transcriptional LysR family regulator
MKFDLEEIVDLALFARVVDARSMSEAARRTGIAKSAVSKRIAGLEQRLGIELLRRTTRAIHMTPEGARFYEHCAQILASARAATTEVAGAGTSMAGVIHVSAPVTFARMHLTRAIARFQRDYPEVDIILATDDRLVDIVASGCDVVIRISRLKDASFVARRLAVDRLVVVGSPDYFEHAGRPRTPADLSQHNCMHYDLVSQSAEWRFRGADRRPLVAPRGNFTATSGDVLCEAALAGVGLAVVPYFMVARDVAAGRLELLLDDRRKAELGIFAITQSARGQPLRLRKLLAHLRRWFAEIDWASPAP